jgi:hypothetical protein
MTLTNHKTVKKTATVTSVMLVVPADRIGLELGMGYAYPADVLSPGAFFMPPQPEPEQLWSRQNPAAMRMRMPTHAAGTVDVPDAVPASWAGSLSPSASADRNGGANAARASGRSQATISHWRNRCDCHPQSQPRCKRQPGLATGLATTANS